MIKYNRNVCSPPQHLTGSGAKEREKNIAKAGSDQAFTFTAYKHESVKTCLQTIFGRKCAFCESLLMGTQPGDVEHYRPKQAVCVDYFIYVTHPTPKQEKLNKVGYYWLGAEWTNLLLCCLDCNRRRKQKQRDGESFITGKGGYFPLADETKRATKPDEEINEEPLLLNPCIDDPEQHLVFSDEGEIFPAILNGTASQKGISTISCLGLARAELFQMRARHRRTVMAAIHHTIAKLERKEDPGADLKDLLELLEPKSAYVAYTRSLVTRHMKEYLEALFANT
jgi:uncharacterized protein (TIGR02646 family)